MIEKILLQKRVEFSELPFIEKHDVTSPFVIYRKNTVVFKGHKMDHRIFLKTDLSVYHINGIQFLIRIAAYPVFSDYVFVCFVILVVRDMPDDLVLKFLLIAQTKFEQVAFRFDKVIDIHGSTRVKIIVIHTMIKEEHINAVSEQDRKDLRSSFPGDVIKYLVAVTNAQLPPQSPGVALQVGRIVNEIAAKDLFFKRSHCFILLSL